ncbi:hypothetical protein EJ05DRAFT_486072 [Pseudovirgaria hyperparasitica]|uniref:Cupredoxin n=1 Tax=Pseudovirgaria hyperparasitica TaxID=470096 RepID=A0A6A6W5X2_9PEZI|nr:uncharacterized protein EJ05DRAFT_486072 [Pseudovirgaria hyperparasitica]KAF2758003.1 hypothetical protein EJ05DRAFT_486072 [Pseudovirgaria hyperparasitica]
MLRCFLSFVLFSSHLLLPVLGRTNLDVFYWPSKVGLVPALQEGDRVNLSWISSFQPNVMTLWCGDNNQVAQFLDMPAEGSHTLNVTAAWAFPCHIQMAKQASYGWFDSGQMDRETSERDTQFFTAPSDCAVVESPVPTGSQSQSPTPTNNSSCPAISSCPTIAPAESSTCPVYNKGVQLGIGVGIGVGASLAIATIIGATFWCSRRAHTDKQRAMHAQAYHHYSGGNTYWQPRTAEHDQPKSPVLTPTAPTGGYINGQPVELRANAGPFELNTK